MARIGLKPPSKEIQAMPDPAQEWIEDIPYAPIDPGQFPEEEYMPEMPGMDAPATPMPGKQTGVIRQPMPEQPGTIPQEQPGPVGRFAEDDYSGYGPDLTQEESEYLAAKYGPGVYAPGQYKGEAFGGGPTLPVEGGEVTMPKGQGVDLEMLFVADPDKFAESFPAMITEEGKFDHAAYQKVQAAKQGIGPKPPDERLTRDVDWTDAAGFEKTLINRIGFDPVRFNPFQEMENRTLPNLPALFDHTFGRQGISWADRSSMTPEMNAYWIKVKNSYRAQELQKLKFQQKQGMATYTMGMKHFHTMAGKMLTQRSARQKATEKAAEVKPAQWQTARNNMEKSYKFKTLGNLIHQQESKDLVLASQKIFDDARLEMQKGNRKPMSPLELKMSSVNYVTKNVADYWSKVDQLKKGADDYQAKIDFYNAEIKRRIGHVPKAKVIDR